MEKKSIVDVCIVCALPEEVRALLTVLQQQCEGDVEECVSPRYHYDYRLATIRNSKDEALNVYITWLPRYGPEEMVLHLSRVLEECQPRIAIMTGICAGDIEHVQLGDLVVAERTFSYDSGKFTRDVHDRMVHMHDAITYQLDANILQFLRLFEDWRLPVMQMKRPSSSSETRPEQRKIDCHIKAMASGSAVRADNPFEDVRVPVRGTVAIDMEGAAFGLVMSRHPSIRWLIVKGVCDYANQDKNDAYHDYSARVSAIYAISFMRAYVNNERLPCQSIFPPSSRAGPVEVGDVAYTPDLSSESLHQQVEHGVSATRKVIAAQSQFSKGLGQIGKPKPLVKLGKRFLRASSFIFKIVVFCIISGLIFNPAVLFRNGYQHIQDQDSIGDTNLFVHLTAVQSVGWEKLLQRVGVRDDTSLFRRIGVINSAERPYRSFSIVLEIQRKIQQPLTIFVEQIQLLLQKVPPSPQQLYVIADQGEHVSYVSNVFKAIYEGEQADGEPIEAEYQDQARTVVLASGEQSDKIKIQVYSLQPADIQFRIQLIYRLSVSNREQALLLLHTFEVIFSDGSNWHIV